MNPAVAVIQMVSSQHVDVNLIRAEALMTEAAGGGAQALFLPENFAALGNSNPRAIADGETGSAGPVRSFLSEMSRRLSCWVFAGTVPLATRPDGSVVEDGRVRAASLVYGDNGIEISRYDKIHMFDVDVDDSHGTYRESETFEPGTEISIVESPVGRVGLTVCYDIRFPELYRKLFTRGIDLFAVPSAFTTVTGKAHFKLLMQSRAVENSCFTVAACQGGEHDSGRKTYGHSMVVDPWGDVVGELGVGEGVLHCELDIERQQQIRREMPFIQQRRLFDE
jgi:deaminated glutathione amidase